MHYARRALHQVLVSHTENTTLSSIQQVSEDGELQYQKVAGSLNPADLMAKTLTAAKIHDFMTKLKQTRRGERAAEGLALNPCRRP